MTGQVKGLGGNAYTPDIGYVWKSADPTCPAELYARTTWAQIKDQAILASGDTYINGDSGGSTTATLSAEEMPAHAHEGTTSSAGAHTHTVRSGYTGIGSEGEYGSYTPYSGSSTTSTNGDHTHTVNVGNSGEGKAFSILMPYVVRYMWERIG